jgi:predicted nuclease of predicted toxin-antitoxin system
MGLRFKLDENIPRNAETLLRDAGHNVQTVIEERLGGRPDIDVLDACLREARILVTLDLDFADIRINPPANHSGIWALRPPMQNVESILNLLRGALELSATEPTEKRLWVVEYGRVRIRG